MITLGIDPGLTGAFALYSPKYAALQAPGAAPAEDTPLLFVFDMPTIKKEVSGKPRTIMDTGGLLELTRTLRDIYTIDRVVIEEVGGMPGQSGSAAFNFGFGVGLLHMAFASQGVQFDIVRPSAWKKAVKAPADKKLAVQRADELFPWARGKWRHTSKAKGKVVEILHPDRAEAALLAYWAAGGTA